MTQRSKARGQRARKAQPVGRSSSEGGNPGIPLRVPLTSSDGRLLIRSLAVGVERIAEQLGGGGDLHEIAGIHDADAIGDLGHQSHVVANEEHRGSKILADPEQGIHYLALHDDIQGAGRLVGDDQPWPEANRNRDADPLLHAAAELVGIHVGYLRAEANAVEQFPDAVIEGARRELDIMILQAIPELRLDPGHGIERIHRALGDEGDPSQAHPAHSLDRKIDEVDAIQQHLTAFDTARWPDQAEQGEGNRRLARS